MHFFHTGLLIMFVSLQLVVLVLVGLLAGICMFDGLGSRHFPAGRYRGRPTLGCVYADGCVIEAALSTVTGCSATEFWKFLRSTFSCLTIQRRTDICVCS